MLPSSAVLALMLGAALFVLVHGQGKRRKSASLASNGMCLTHVARAKLPSLFLLFIEVR